MAAKAAKLRCVAVPDKAATDDKRFCIADAVLDSSVDEAGNIKTFHYLKEGWDYVQEGFVWNKLFKIDPF